MRKSLLCLCAVLVCGSTAMAQMKFETKWKCEKPTAEQKYDVGDMADHSYSIAQGTCEATASSKDFAEKSGAYTEFSEGWKSSLSSHGRYNSIMADGDKVYFKYEGSGPTDIKKPIKNKWAIEGGTGKYKGIKGSGTCEGMRNADGSAEWTCSGTHEMGKMNKMEKTEKKAK
ncbi:MAG: hypothetical protein ACRD5M_07730 [Candidatus Acidiferrales bacterium]